MARRQGAWGHVEHVDDPHLTARRTLSLVGERMGRRVQGRVAVPPSLPLGIERTALAQSGSSGSASGTFRVEWQCDSHCHSVVSVLGGAPYTATRHRACRIGTFRGEWQCNQYARERVAVRRTLPLGIERTALARSEASGSAGRDGLRTRSRHADWRVAQLGKCARATARQAAGGLRQSRQASAWGLTARKGAVWAEGLADGALWARPGYYKAASCGLRRYRELRLRVRLVYSHGMSRMGAETYTNRSNQPQS